MPDLSLEIEAGGTVAGIDEAGRGPLAGPVVAAAVILDRRRTPRWLRDGIDDSKALAAARRRELCDGLLACARIGVGAASVLEIETTNILLATFLAMRRAVARLGAPPDLALVDGHIAPALPCPARAVVGGDGRSLSIAAASIVAKVTRDRIMAALAPRYPGYGWETNVGYATLAHRSALAQLGITRHHRRTFSPIDNMLSPEPPAVVDVGCGVPR